MILVQGQNSFGQWFSSCCTFPPDTKSLLTVVRKSALRTILHPSKRFCCLFIELHKGPNRTRFDWWTDRNQQVVNLQKRVNNFDACALCGTVNLFLFVNKFIHLTKWRCGLSDNEFNWWTKRKTRSIQTGEITNMVNLLLQTFQCHLTKKIDVFDNLTEATLWGIILTDSPGCLLAMARVRLSSWGGTTVSKLVTTSGWPKVWCWCHLCAVQAVTADRENNWPVSQKSIRAKNKQQGSASKAV